MAVGVMPSHVTVQLIVLEGTDVPIALVHTLCKDLTLVFAQVTIFIEQSGKLSGLSLFLHQELGLFACQ